MSEKLSPISGLTCDVATHELGWGRVYDFYLIVVAS